MFFIGVESARRFLQHPCVAFWRWITVRMMPSTVTIRQACSVLVSKVEVNDRSTPCWCISIPFSPLLASQTLFSVPVAVRCSTCVSRSVPVPTRILSRYSCCYLAKIDVRACCTSAIIFFTRDKPFFAIYQAAVALTPRRLALVPQVLPVPMLHDAQCYNI